MWTYAQDLLRLLLTLSFTQKHLRTSDARERCLKAYILISTKPGTSLEVVKRIKDKVKEVVAADAIFGRYDAILVLEAPALENINQVVYRIIEKDPNVIRTETSIVLECT